jgi:ankyrin repeat protein
LPLHYLFSNIPELDTNTFKISNFYKLSQSSLTKTLTTHIGPHISNQATIATIDPVELLTILLKQTESSLVDTRDLYGYSPLQYACIRGSAIACSILIAHGGSIFTRGLDNNTPLSSAVYFKREMCTLTLLNHIKSANIYQESSMLNDVYHLHPSLYSSNSVEVNKVSSENESQPLRFIGNVTVDQDLYPVTTVSLYHLILSNKWEGINWLVLGDLNVYGLTDFDSIQIAVQAKQFGLALRLIEKIESKIDQLDLFRLLTSKNNNNNQTLLHTIASLDIKNIGLSEKDTLKQILRKIFLQNRDKIPQYGELLNEYLLLKDSFGSNALHYACYNHNFDMIDFLFGYLGNGSSQLVTAESLLKNYKDSAQQTAYSLLFWQLGRVDFSKEAKEKIKSYTGSYITSGGGSINRIEQVARAHFPRLAQPSFSAGKRPNETNKLVKDYPPLSASSLLEQHQISPLLYAINRQNFDMTKFLLNDLGFDVNTTDSEKASALVYAIRTNNIDLCKLLLNHDYVISNSTDTAAKKNANNNNNKVYFCFLSFQKTLINF